MYLAANGNLVSLTQSLAVYGEYETRDGRDPGRLSLHFIDSNHEEERVLRLSLDPCSLDGFWIEYWIHGNAITVCGEAGLLVIEGSSLATAVTIWFEIDECKTLPQPWLVRGDGTLIIATESRVFCFDTRLRARWCWSVRVHSDEWWQLAAKPTIVDDTVVVPLVFIEKTANIRLAISDGHEILESGQTWPER